MKWFVFGIGISALIIGAGGCEDSEQRQARSSVCEETPSTPVQLEIDFLDVFNAGNPDDGPMNLGSRSNISIGKVDYNFQIAKYETTNAQYAEFLNAQASGCSCVGEVDENGVCTTEERSDLFDLYGETPNYGMTRTGQECHYVYAPELGQESWPAQGINFFKAIRFANWYNNGRPAFIPQAPLHTVSQCKGTLKDAFKIAVPGRIKGCLKLSNVQGFQGIGSPVSSTSGIGSGLTIDTGFTVGTRGNPSTISSVSVNDPGSGYQPGDTLTFNEGVICDGIDGVSTAGTVTLLPEHFRTNADLSTEAGSAIVCKAIPNPQQDSLGAETALDRSNGAEYFVPSGDEWHKAAYYNPADTLYSDFPTKSDTEPACACPGATGNAANCGSVLGRVSGVGAYLEAASHYGTYDQGGNLSEWTDDRIQTDVLCNPGDASAPNEKRITRGGTFYLANRPNISYLEKTSSYTECAITSYATSGFRLAKCDDSNPGQCSPGPPGS